MAATATSDPVPSLTSELLPQEKASGKTVNTQMKGQRSKVMTANTIQSRKGCGGRKFFSTE
jgi:hypothetical protein